MSAMIPKKEYLGDGVYVEPAGYGITLIVTTEDGMKVTNRIALEEREFSALLDYHVRLRDGVREFFRKHEDHCDDRRDGSA